MECVLSCVVVVGYLGKSLVMPSWFKKAFGNEDGEPAIDATLDQGEAVPSLTAQERRVVHAPVLSDSAEDDAAPDGVRIRARVEKNGMACVFMADRALLEGYSIVGRLGSVFLAVLEGDLDLGAVGAHLTVFQLHVELDDLGDAQVLQGTRGRLDGRGGSLFPGFCAGADQLDDLVDAFHFCLLCAETVWADQIARNLLVWVQVPERKRAEGRVWPKEDDQE